jgi:hypothetical protein
MDGKSPKVARRKTAAMAPREKKSPAATRTRRSFIQLKPPGFSGSRVRGNARLSGSGRSIGNYSRRGGIGGRIAV